MRLLRFDGGCFAALAVLWFGGCSSDDTHPPAAPTSPSCEEWNCVEGPSPIGAVAVEHGMAGDGGRCDAWRFSLPTGDDAFTSIRSCGGNQIRCGSSDYRISANDLGTTLTCVVAPSNQIRLRGHVSQTDGTHFDVDGDIDSKGGTVTISAGTPPDGGAFELEPASCRVTDVEFVVPGSIWAKFDCGPEGDASTCAVRGTFVFENCAKETDAGPQSASGP
jgi:hypothetical protein